MFCCIMVHFSCIHIRLSRIHAEGEKDPIPDPLNFEDLKTLSCGAMLFMLKMMSFQTFSPLETCYFKKKIPGFFLVDHETKS